MADMDRMIEAIASISDAGLNLRSMNFNLELQLAEDTDNMSSGMQAGFGPRYGMAPLIGQSTLEAIDANGTYGILGASASTTATTQAVYGLFRVYAILPVPMIDQTSIGSTTSPKLRKTYFWACIGLAPTAGNASGRTMLCWVPLGTTGASNFGWVPKAAIAYGLLRPLVLDATNFFYRPGSYRIAGSNQAGSTNFDQFRNLQNIALPSGTIDYCSSAILSVSGSSEPAPWIVGTKITQGDADTSATACFTGFGCPNFPIDRKFIEGKRTWKLYNVGLTGLEAEYDFNKTPTYTDLLATADQNLTTAHLTGTFVDGSATLVQRLDGTAPTYTNVNVILWNDQANYMNTEHSLLLAAPGKPLALVVQGWQRDTSANLEQWIDLRRRRFAPPCRQTLNVDDTSLNYTESVTSSTLCPTPVQTCWRGWLPFVEGVATRKMTDIAVARGTAPAAIALGTANSGILRANTTYEFAYSVYDKQLGVESNVGVPAKIRTATDDFVSLCLFADEYSGGFYKQRVAAASSKVWIFAASALSYLADNDDTSIYVINYVQFRVYYRALGSFEWLPALFIDASSYFFNPNLKELMACQGAIAGSVGGQPGGFNDYSDLPDDIYNCVLVWKNRVFWLSAKSLCYSYVNNGFSYPVRNAVPIPQGEYKGAIVHNYPGQADQDSRLVVFGTKEIYVGKFTGVRQQMAVQVDPENLGTFEVDGTDLILNAWTSVTAFSYRSACVADGILYYWGPQGIYRDDGRDTPTKISDVLEPDLFTLYAKQRTDDIHCTYSEQTKEITWFYFDNNVYTTYAATENQTKLLIYNTETDAFYFSSTSACIDASQKLNSGSGTLDLVRATGGDRTVIFNRISKASTGTQQAYFYDYRNRAGDMRYGLERLVSVIATPSTGTRRLTLPNGATGISVGDFISTDQINAYTNDQDSSGTAIVVEDFVAKVTAVNTTGTNYIDVELPSNIVSNFVTAATLGTLNSFPIYVGKTILAAASSAGNAFSYNFESQYWCPKGMNFNAFWKFIHFLFKVTFLKAEGLLTSSGASLTPQITYSHRSPTSPAYVSEELVLGELEDGVWRDNLNSDGHQQIYHMNTIGSDNFEGQGLKVKLSGLHYAHKWLLQYMAMYGNPQTYDFLKRFEG